MIYPMCKHCKYCEKKDYFVAPCCRFVCHFNNCNSPTTAKDCCDFYEEKGKKNEEC